MIDWNNSLYGIRLPNFQVFNRKTGKTVKVCDTPHEAKQYIEKLNKKKKNVG